MMNLQPFSLIKDRKCCVNRVPLQTPGKSLSWLSSGENGPLLADITGRVGIISHYSLVYFTDRSSLGLSRLTEV